MHIATHLLTGWAGTLPADIGWRDRRLLVFASVVPDADGLVVIADLAQGRALDQCELFATYHHLLCHNALFALVASTCLAAAARRRVLVGLLSWVLIHVHFLADIVGSMGPDGSQWEIPYLAPFSDAVNLVVSWQWALNAWPNILLTIALMALAFFVAWSRGFSPVGLFSRRADTVFVRTLRTRFGEPAEAGPPDPT